MSSLSLAFSVVFPLFLMMVLGCFLRKIGLFPDDFLHQLNGLCFQVFLPLVLFINVYDSDFSAAFQPRLVGYALLSLLVLFALLMLLVPKLEREGRRCGVLVQGIFRSNFILFGIPVTATLFGEEQLGVASVLIAFVVPVFNVLAVFALEFFRGGKPDGRRIVKGVVTNPLILGVAAALVFVLSGLRLPSVLERTVRDISQIATPLALIVLGGSFHFSSLRRNWKPLALAAVGRLIVVPALFLLPALALGLRGVALGALLAMFASPTAVSSFSMAQQMEADDELAGQIVVVTSLGSVLTVFLWIALLSHAGVLFP